MNFNILLRESYFRLLVFSGMLGMPFFRIVHCLILFDNAGRCKNFRP